MTKILLLLYFCIPFALQSAIIEHYNEFEDVPINSTVGFSVPKFDSSLGDLNKIEFQLTGSFTGASRTENLSPAPVSITLDNKVRFQQGITSGPMLFDEHILKQDIFLAQGWDGSFPPDWTGPSGEEFVFTDEVIQTFILEKSDMASLSLFTGIGVVDIPATVKDASTTSISGPNIVASQFENMKSVYSLVRYHYTPVPEPEIWGLTGVAVCGIVIFYARRKTRIN
jgi:hypothetical protein